MPVILLILQLLKIYIYIHSIHKTLIHQIFYSIKKNMVLLGFVFMARTQNVEYIEMPESEDWHVIVKCSHCHQQFPKQITFNKNQTVQMMKQHGVAHFGASCKNCQRKCFITLDETSTYKVTPNQDGIIKEPIAKVDCRGCQVTKVNLGNSLTVKVANSPTSFQNADFSDLWCQVDQQTDLLAQVQDPKIQIVHHK